MGKFLRSIHWWELEPHPELVSDSPEPYCAAVPGREYVVYLRYGGSAKVDLRPSGAEDRFEFTWRDLATDREAKRGEVTGGDARRFSPPEDYPRAAQYKDWLLHVRRKP